MHFVNSHLHKLDDGKKNASTKDDEKKEKTALEEKEKLEQQEMENAEHKMKVNMVAELRPLWNELSKHLEELEKSPDMQNSILGLQDGMCAQKPIIPEIFQIAAAEAFFLCYSLVIPPSKFSTPNEKQHGELAQSQNSATESTTKTRTSAATATEMDEYQKEMFSFAGLFGFSF